MKLVLFQASSSGKILPGLLKDDGVVDISAAVPKNHTPQLVMQGIIDDFEKLRPVLESLARDSATIALEQVRLLPPLPSCTPRTKQNETRQEHSA